MITPDPGVYNISASPTDNSNQSDQGKMTVIGIEKLQLKQDTGNWEDAEEKYVAYVGDNLQIKALIAPSGVTWPSDIPTWQGNFSDTSLSDTRIVDTSQTDEFTITAECGTSQKCVEIEVKPVELKIPPAVLRDGQAENPQNTLQIKAGNKKYKLKISVPQGTGSAVFAGNKTEIEYTGKASDEWDKVFIQGVLESSQENNIKITILLDNKEIASVTTIVYSEIKSVFSSAERQHKDSTEECLTCTANGNNILDSPPMGHTTGLIHSTTFHMLCSHCNSYCAHCCLSILKGGKQDSYRALGTTSVTANHNLGMNLMLVYSSSVPKVKPFAVSIVLVMFASIVWLLTGLSGAASIPPPLTVHTLPYNPLIAMAKEVSRLTGCESPLVLNLARGFHWQELIDEGAYPNIKELAKAIGIDSGVVAKAIRLTWLSPKIIHKIIIGEVDISMQTLRRNFPIVWSKQEKELL